MGERRSLVLLSSPKKWTRNGLMMGLLIFRYVFCVCMLANKGRGL